MNWSEIPNGRVFASPDNDTFLLVVLDVPEDKIPLDFALLLEMGGKGGWDVIAEGTRKECEEEAESRS